MSLPPSILHIKRKRDEGAPSSLVFETGLPSKRRITEHPYVFRRLEAEDEIANAAPSPETVQRTSENASTPRRFQFARNDVQHVAAGSRKRKHTLHSKDVPTFIEYPQQRVGDQGGQGLQVADADKEAAAKSPARKRPTAFKTFRNNTNRSHVQISEDFSRTIQEHALALDAVTTTSRTPIPEKDVDAMDTSEDEYVYDTYVRHLKSDTEDLEIEAKDGRSIGYLVIPEADQSLWETYYDSDAESEDDWDSEKDDENAENFYGADYPEDELDSDDDGEGAYRYHKGSDEEEYDSGDEYSDHESNNPNRWNDVVTMTTEELRRRANNT